MFIYKGGSKVNSGTYWNVTDGSRVDYVKEEILPGSGKQKYVRVSSVVMLLIGPILGLLYMIFLPVASIAVVAILTLRKVLNWMVGLLSKLAYFEWRPAESYLSGKKKVKGQEQKTDNVPNSGRKGGSK